MKTFLYKTIIFSIIFLSSITFAANNAICQRVVDGDTIMLNDGRKVRLIGVDTPECKDPRKPVQYYSKEASKYLKEKLEGKPIRLEYDPINAGRNNKGKYGRTLAYVYNDGKLINKEIIKNGYGYAYTKYPYDSKMKTEFCAAENFAKKSGKGMWKNQYKQKSDNIFVSIGKSFFAGLTGHTSPKTVKYKSTKEASTSRIYSNKRVNVTKAKNYWKKKSSSKKNYVKGYIRENGTKVGGYFRSKRKNNESSGNKGKVYVHSYTRANGTKVSGYRRSRPSRKNYSSGGYSSGSGSGGNSGSVSVRGYTRSNGTYVHGYTRSAPSKKR